MFELRTLGQAELATGGSSSTSPVLSRPRDLALLTYLVLARPGGFHRRDTLLAMFWPDLDESHARNALSQALHRLRDGLGAETIVTRGRHEIRARDGAIRCDAIEFDRKLESGDASAALELYKGRFLDGFHVRGTVEFERWMDAEADRLQRCAFETACGLADLGECEGNIVEASRWLRRALELVPADEGVVRRLVSLLARTGDRTGALDEYERAARFLSEMGLAPSPETVKTVDAIRGRSSAVGGKQPYTGIRAGSDVTALAILPFENLAADEEWFADGMTSALIAELARIKGLRVISHQSVRRYRGSTKTVREIASELNVGAVVTGVVLRAGSRVRITATLIRAEPEEHLWAEQYDREMGDVLRLHGELATAIAERVPAAISAADRRRLAAGRRVRPEACEAYVRGRHFTSILNEIPRGFRYLEEAIELDPTFGPAHAALALCLANRAMLAHEPPAEAAPRLEAAARRALELDDGLGEAHTALAVGMTMFEWDWAAAEREYRLALEMSPGSADSHAYFAGYLCAAGRFDDAMAEAMDAKRLDPLGPWTNFMLGWTLYRVRRYDESIRQLLGLLELYPRYVLAHLFLAENYLCKGMSSEAARECRRALSVLPGDQLLLGIGGCILGLAGERDEAGRLLEELKAMAARRYVSPAYLAAAHLGLDNRDRAFAGWTAMLTDGAATAHLVPTDPLFDCVRMDARFIELSRALGLPAAVPESQSPTRARSTRLSRRSR